MLSSVRHLLPVLCHVKNSLGLKAPCLLFEPVTTKDGVVGIEWRGACEYSGPLRTISSAIFIGLADNL
jgi:hypothetical protein